MTGAYKDPEAIAAAKALGPAFEGVDACVVFGSGLHPAGKALGVKKTADYFKAAGKSGGVPGHPGKAGIAAISGQKVLVLMGRTHFYENSSMKSAALTVRIANVLGARFTALFSAVGGVREDLSVGDFVFVEDHINLMGQNPLLGEHAGGGVPFIDLTGLYSPHLYEPAARMLPGITLKKGVLASFCGPTYETPAEVRMAAALGADMVGMSTVPEAVWARFMGMEVTAFGRIANPAAGTGEAPLSHDDVLREAGLGGEEAAMVAAAVISAWAERETRR